MNIIETTTIPPASYAGYQAIVREYNAHAARCAAIVAAHRAAHAAESARWRAAQRKIAAY